MKHNHLTLSLAILSLAVVVACAPDPVKTADDPGQTTDDPGQTTDDPGQTTINVHDVTISAETLELEVGESQTLSATVLPDDATNKNVSWSSDNEEVVTVSQEGVVCALMPGKANITVTTADQEKTAMCAVSVWPAMEAVDLGLSVRWATCNLGATSESGDGGLYQWAGTKDVSSTDIDLSWGNCPYHVYNMVSTKGWKKYNTKNTQSSTVDNKTDLEAEDDAASAILGRGWRIPTALEWAELRDNTTREWTETGGRNGYRFTSTKEGYKDKSIFLPASGERYGTYAVYYANKTGYYWSATLDKDTPSSAKNMKLENGSNPDLHSLERYIGASVRAVIK